jgi:hypothetical protein
MASSPRGVRWGFNDLPDLHLPDLHLLALILLLCAALAGAPVPG